METLLTPRSAPARPCRDRELLVFLGRHGAASIEHVMRALGVGQTMAYRRVAACVDRGLVERVALLRAEPTLLRATREGLRYAGLGLPVAEVSPGGAPHQLRCVSVALALGERHGHERVLTERELRDLERRGGKPFASARVGELPSGHPRLHRPDLVLLPAGVTDSALAPDRGRAGPGRSRTQGGERGERPIAIEVELRAKEPRRLEQILRAWRRASWVAEVRYLCAPGKTRSAVERAIRKTRAEGRVLIEEVVPR